MRSCASADTWSVYSWAGSCDWLTICNNGNIGIGCTSPNKGLYVKDNIAVGRNGACGSIYMPVNTGAGNAGIMFSTDPNSSHQNFTGQCASMGFSTYSTTCGLWFSAKGCWSPHDLIVKKTGRVGIGVLAPQAHLHVGGGGSYNFECAYGGSSLKVQAEIAITNYVHIQTGLWYVCTHLTSTKWICIADFCNIGAWNNTNIQIEYFGGGVAVSKGYGKITIGIRINSTGCENSWWVGQEEGGGGGGMRRKAMVDATTMPRACVGANASESPHLQTRRPPDGRAFSKRLARVSL